MPRFSDFTRIRESSIMYDHGCLLENQNTYQKDSVDIDLPKRVPTGFSGREGARRIISTQRSTKNEKKKKVSLAEKSYGWLTQPLPAYISCIATSSPGIACHHKLLTDSSDQGDILSCEDKGCKDPIGAELRRPEEPLNGAPYPCGKAKETHELILSCLSWLAVLLVGVYATRRRRSHVRWRSNSSNRLSSVGLKRHSLILDTHVIVN